MSRALFRKQAHVVGVDFVDCPVLKPVSIEPTFAKLVPTGDLGGFSLGVATACNHIHESLQEK